MTTLANGFRELRRGVSEFHPALPGFPHPSMIKNDGLSFIVSSSQASSLTLDRNVTGILVYHKCVTFLINFYPCYIPILRERRCL